jgi:hypothetical protein
MAGCTRTAIRGAVGDLDQLGDAEQLDDVAEPLGEAMSAAVMPADALVVHVAGHHLGPNAMRR